LKGKEPKGRFYPQPNSSSLIPSTESKGASSANQTLSKTTASHEIINAAYDQLGVHQEQLGKLIGEQEAVRIVIMALAGPEQRLANQS
jgi:hypothetical protein